MERGKVPPVSPHPTLGFAAGAKEERERDGKEESLARAFFQLGKNASFFRLKKEGRRTEEVRSRLQRRSLFFLLPPSSSFFPPLLLFLLLLHPLPPPPTSGSYTPLPLPHCLFCMRKERLRSKRVGSPSNSFSSSSS